MTRRMLQMLIAVALFVGAIGFVKFRQIQGAIAQGKSFRPPPEAVTTVVARDGQWPATLEAIGSVAAVQGVTLSADLAGVVDKITFQSGQHVHAGDALVLLDTRQERAQLAATKAARDLAKTSLERSRKLLDQQVISQSEFDQASAAYQQAQANVDEIQASIERKTIRAPFAGVLGIRQVNLGQYLKSGDPVAPLQSLDPIYVNFGVPQQQVAELHVGAEVRVAADSAARDQRTGRITAINSVVDEATRNVQVQATFANARETLRPGMFVTVQVLLGPRHTVIALPVTAINYAPYGNSVFVVETMKGPDGASYQGVRQQFVSVGASRGDQVAVLSGVKPGDEIVTSGVFKLRSGQSVLVNNKVMPGNSPAPKPENS